MTCKLMSLQASDTFLLKWKTVLKKLASITNIRYDVFFMEGDTSYFSRKWYHTCWRFYKISWQKRYSLT